MIIKNSNIRRSLFENRYVIFAIIFGIILFFSLIQTINKNLQQQHNVENNVTQNTSINTQKENQYSNIAISEGNTQTSQQETANKIIEEFITYCNNKDIVNAYNLLTEDCKKEVFFNNIQYFKENYVDRIFTTKKMVDIQNWMNSYVYTYKVKILNDILSTGAVSSLGDPIEDYYTVVQQENTWKLNINSYILKQEINNEKELNGIKITVLLKDIYKEYETYDIKIENNSSKTILLDSQEKVDSTYVVGSNENNYTSFLYEIDKTNLIIEPNSSITITIRFNKLYSNKTIMEEMVFSDIITDYENYNLIEDKSLYTNRVKITIEI